jgi:hypothetical protein
MFLPLLLGTQTPTTQPTEPHWTGEVYAFATYINLDLRPEEQVSTVFVARKTYEDGATVTYVRTVPAKTLVGSLLKTRARA